MPQFHTRPLTDSDLALADGRKLTCAEYGDRNGVPLFVFHGLPGSRLSWGLLPDPPFPPGVRVIAPDRPGYGGSDPHPGRSLLSWADDVAAVADTLELGRFGVLGISGGGPGALACASRMPERLIAVGTEALRRGAAGMVDDMNANHGRPWGFALEAIRCHVESWSCGLDRSVSPAMGRYLATAVPDSELIEIAEAGHLWVLTHLRDVVSRLLETASRTEGRP